MGKPKVGGAVGVVPCSDTSQLPVWRGAIWHTRAAVHILLLEPVGQDCTGGVEGRVW